MHLREFFEGPRPRSLRTVRFTSGLTVLYLAPHPDDFDAIGVTMRLCQANGCDIHVAVDRSGSGIEDGYGGRRLGVGDQAAAGCAPSDMADRRPKVLTAEDRAAIREGEQRRSCAFFGLPGDRLTFMRMEEDAEAQPLRSAANLHLLRTLFAAVRPDLVFLPHGNDTNTGHQRMYAMFRQVAQDANHPLVAFYVRDPKTISLRTDLYTAFGEDDARWKARLLRFHDLQHQRNLHTRGHGFDDRILASNRQIARELGLREPYAEAFELDAIPNMRLT